jgi:glutathione S-transferase
MKLYYATAACSLAPHIILRELGQPVELIPVSLKGSHYKGGEFSKVNPKGYVPTLELDSGEILTEGAVIMQYLADRQPEKKLMPASGTMERYRCLEWLNFIATEIHKGFSPLFGESTPEVRANAVQLLKKRLQIVAAQLEKTPYLMGKEFSVADAYLFTVLNWSGFVKLDLSDFPVFANYLENLRQRPAVLEALRAEGLVQG